ncbi:hypothetical protein NQ315_013967 [Exocentrus adspersus]|uniref:COX assembly mitochondrial protein n=1 Tax=Exocentrus adspersus TaxID=1586481 RepID=A0AAV8VRW0_9CUCU|nr:hypothetical protein NQ315_013967 [Exocentrus adspersus]
MLSVSYPNIITCLKKNEKCMIRCKKHMDDFVNCIDAQRMNIIREKYEMEQKMNNMQQDNEITKQFFNSRNIVGVDYNTYDHNQ